MAADRAAVGGQPEGWPVGVVMEWGEGGERERERGFYEFGWKRKLENVI